MVNVGKPDPRDKTELQKKVAEMLLRGEFTAAMTFVKDAIGRGDVDAKYIMGTLQLKGIGTPPNAAAAAEYLSAAAKEGHTQAMITLSQMYAEGNGVPSDIQHAIQFCEKAAASGDPRALVIIGTIYENGDFGLSKNLIMAVQYYQRATEAGDARGPFMLSRLYMTGEGVSKDRERAFNLCAQSAALGDDEGLNALAFLYETGFEGHPQEAAKAYSLYRKAARLGHVAAKRSLRRFPPVVQLGAISCSRGIASELTDEDRAELLARHQAGDWGDVDTSEWDKNDSALASGGAVQSVHEAPQLAVIVYTEGNRRSTFMELVAEDYEPQWSDIAEMGRRALQLFKLARTVMGIVSDLRGTA